MEINVPDYVHPYIRQRVFLWADDDNEVEVTEIESKDWINELPESILSFVLSFLTIKEAAGTSMIYRQWRQLWLDHVLNY
ncbi:hypothetical protein ACE6H2_012178 [Prunus campanulata]